MHKGWWVAVALVVAQLAIGGAVYYSTHKNSDPESTEIDTIPDPEINIERLLESGELMLFSADAVDPVAESVLEVSQCVRVCAVPGDDDDALAGQCSAPVKIAGSLEGESGSRLLIAIHEESAPSVHPYLAASERRLMFVPADQCAGPRTDPPLPRNEESSEESL